MKKMTHEEYIKIVYEKVGDEYIILEKYINTKTKILTKHNIDICGFEYYVSPNKFLMGRRCPKCARKKNSKIRNQIKKEKRKTLLQRIYEMDGGVFSLYSGNADNIENSIFIFHSICGKIFEAKIDNFLYRKAKCPFCARKIYKSISKQKTTQEFKDELFEKYGNKYLLLNEYHDNKTKVKIRCSCTYEWDVLPSNILQFGCPACAIERRKDFLKKDPEVFKKQVASISNGEYELIGEYYRSNKKVTLRHLICGTIFDIIANNFLKRKRGCPKCCPISLGENKIEDFLNNCGSKFKRNCSIDGCKDIHHLPFDFLIYGFNENKKIVAAIEYNGLQHYEPVDFFGGGNHFDSQNKHDEIKRIFCLSNNIKFIEISYLNFNDLEQILEKELIPLLKKEVNNIDK